MKVYLDDRNMNYVAAQQRFYKAAGWAREHCKSYTGIDIIDVSDFSTIYDTVAEYRFSDDKDATMFSLRWK